MSSGEKQFFPVIISAPSGSGKSSVKNAIFKKDGRFAFSVTCTTRKRRSGEVNGRDYFFVTKKRFDVLRKKGALLEWAKVHGHFYGTPAQFLKKILKRGKIPVMTIDVKGARSVKRVFPEAVSVFILPPSLKTLLKRLAERGESEGEIKIRMKTALREMSHAAFFDYLVVNDRVDDAAEKIIGIVNSEILRTRRNFSIIQKFRKELRARRH